MTATKEELMARYATATFATSSARFSGAHEAALATKYAIENVEVDYNRRLRQCGEEQALQVLEMDAEDAETARRRMGV